MPQSNGYFTAYNYFTAPNPFTGVEMPPVTELSSHTFLPTPLPAFNLVPNYNFANSNYPASLNPHTHNTHLNMGNRSSKASSNPSSQNNVSTPVRARRQPHGPNQQFKSPNQNSNNVSTESGSVSVSPNKRRRGNKRKQSSSIQTDQRPAKNGRLHSAVMSAARSSLTRSSSLDIGQGFVISDDFKSEI